VPLLALAIATPTLRLRRRLQMLAIGVPLLFSLHVLDIVAHLPHFIEYYYMHRLGFATLVVDSLGVIGLAVVFIIWFAICYSEFFSRAGS
jgi:exosortase/archaeosortase